MILDFGYWIDNDALITVKCTVSV